MCVSTQSASSLINSSLLFSAGWWPQASFWPSFSWCCSINTCRWERRRTFKTVPRWPKKKCFNFNKCVKFSKCIIIDLQSMCVCSLLALARLSVLMVRNKGVFPRRERLFARLAAIFSQWEQRHISLDQCEYAVMNLTQVTQPFKVPRMISRALAVCCAHWIWMSQTLSWWFCGRIT